MTWALFLAAQRFDQSIHLLFIATWEGHGQHVPKSWGKEANQRGPGGWWWHRAKCQGISGLKQLAPALGCRALVGSQSLEPGWLLLPKTEAKEVGLRGGCSKFVITQMPESEMMPFLWPGQQVCLSGNHYETYWVFPEGPGSGGVPLEPQTYLRANIDWEWTKGWTREG